MSALNPANTIYGQTAQHLHEWAEFKGLDNVREVASAIRMLEQAHLHCLANGTIGSAPNPETAEARTEAAAAALYDARYNPAFLRSVADVNTWESAQDWIKAIYRKDAAAMLAAVDRLEPQ